MTTISLIKHGTDLSSRATGRALRDEVERLAGRGEVVLDFAGVQSASHSFSDELLAVLVEDHGEAWFRNHVRVKNHAPVVRFAILDAIHRRTSPEPEAA